MLFQRSDTKKHVWQVRLNIRKVRGYTFRSTGTEDLSEAVYIATKLYEELSRRAEDGLALQGLNFRVFWEKNWVPYVERTLSIHRYRLHKNIGKKYFIPFFGDKELSEIRERDFEKYWRWRRDYYSTGPGENNMPANAKKHPSWKTLKMEKSLLTQSFRYMKINGLIAALPIVPLTKSVHDTPTNRRPFFDIHEWDQLFKFMETWKDGGRHSLHKFQRRMIRNLVCFLIHSGLRPNEAWQLQWKHLGQTKKHRLKIIVPEDTKTKSRAVVPVEHAIAYTTDIKKNQPVHRRRRPRIRQ